jgi:tRNA threonylcarbamoyladenosine biosynthesis protein TsaE
MATYTIGNLNDIKHVAKAFLQQFGEYKIMAFRGEMGVGKTTFVKALCEQLGAEDVVNSPSFAIVNEYTTRTNDTIYHFDFYRIKNASEVFDMGYEDYLYSGAYCLMEWPEKIEDLLPQNRLDLNFTLNNDGSRTLLVTSPAH